MATWLIYMYVVLDKTKVQITKTWETVTHECLHRSLWSEMRPLVWRGRVVVIMMAIMVVMTVVLTVAIAFMSYRM